MSTFGDLHFTVYALYRTLLHFISISHPPHSCRALNPLQNDYRPTRCRGGRDTPLLRAEDPKSGAKRGRLVINWYRLIKLNNLENTFREGNFPGKTHDFREISRENPKIMGFPGKFLGKSRKYVHRSNLINFFSFKSANNW